MDYERFGRLNSKKNKELKDMYKPPYDMAIFFPYLTTRKKSMDQRHTISSFKKMIEKYRYCYSLFDNCIASIKRNGNDYETECIEINNKVYVFTNNGDFDEIDCELLFDKIAPIPIPDDDGALGYRATSVLSDMKKRKLSVSQYELLKKYILKIKLVSLESVYTPFYKSEEEALNEFMELKDSVFNEFVWRLALYDKGIYKESEPIDSAIKKKRARVEDNHTLFYAYDRYGVLNYIQSLKYIHSFTKKIAHVMQYNHIVTANKLFYEFLQEHYNTVLLDEFTGDKLLEDAMEIYEDKIPYLRSLKENYAFLKNPYSEEYRHFFGKRKKLYSLFSTQQIMRKQKSEYASIDEMLNRLEKEYDKIKNSLKVIKRTINNYRKDLGSNQLPNRGCGFPGDGLSNDDGTGGLMDEIILEAGEQLKFEKMERERIEKERKAAEDEYYYELDHQQSFEEHIQELVKENKPLVIFEFYEEEYFKHYKSITIKEILEVYAYDVLTDVSLEGKFCSVLEMSYWLAENCGVFRDEEGDIVL